MRPATWLTEIDCERVFLCACCVRAGISVLAYVTNSPMCRQALLLAKVCVGLHACMDLRSGYA